MQYEHLHLLGKTVRFSVDVSHVGCGCNAALYLVAMGHPSDGSSRYCDILGGEPGTPPCVEIDLFEGNTKGMTSTVHTVTGFDEGVSFHDPSGLPFLNTLDALSPGYGYWVKVQEDDTLRAPGAPLGGGYLPTLDAGWNLVAYTAEAPLAPALFFGNLIANEELVYVTGFDGGVEVFDPF